MHFLATTRASVPQLFLYYEPVLQSVKDIQKFQGRLFNSTIFGDQGLQKDIKSRF